MKLIAPILAMTAFCWCAFLAWLWWNGAGAMPWVLFPVGAAAVACIAAWYHRSKLLASSAAAMAAAGFIQGFVNSDVSQGIVGIICYLPALAALVVALVNERAGASAEGRAS